MTTPDPPRYSPVEGASAEHNTHSNPPPVAPRASVAPGTWGEHRLTRRGPWLLLELAREHEALSWALVGGPRARVRWVASRQVGRAELGRDVDPTALLTRGLAELGLDPVLGFLTGRNLDFYSTAERTDGELAARCLVTAGMGNALRPGDAASPLAVGTINLALILSSPLTEAARLEALALASEARALAVRECEVKSCVSGLPASGTGTDCIAVLDPVLPDSGDGAREPLVYAGKHTRIGSLAGAVVFEAVTHAVREWQAGRARKLRAAEERV